MKPKRLWEEESPRFAYQTGFTDENPQSVTVTFTQKYKYLGKTEPLGQHSGLGHRQAAFMVFHTMGHVCPSHTAKTLFRRLIQEILPCRKKYMKDQSKMPLCSTKQQPAVSQCLSIFILTQGRAYTHAHILHDQSGL